MLCDEISPTALPSICNTRATCAASWTAVLSLPASKFRSCAATNTSNWRRSIASHPAEVSNLNSSSFSGGTAQSCAAMAATVSGASALSRRRCRNSEWYEMPKRFAVVRKDCPAHQQRLDLKPWGCLSTAESRLRRLRRVRGAYRIVGCGGAALLGRLVGRRAGLYRRPIVGARDRRHRGIELALDRLLGALAVNVGGLRGVGHVAGPSRFAIGHLRTSARRGWGRPGPTTTAAG